MALINCPECGKEISDKSEKCVHCGYPVRTTPYLCEKINGIEVDVSFLKDTHMTKIEKVRKLMELSNCDPLIAADIVLKYCPPQQKSTFEIPKCPHCQSTNISKIGTVERVGSIAMLGIFSKKINKSFECKNCGYTW